MSFICSSAVLSSSQVPHIDRNSSVASFASYSGFIISCLRRWIILNNFSCRGSERFRISFKISFSYSVLVSIIIPLFYFAFVICFHLVLILPFIGIYSNRICFLPINLCLLINFFFYPLPEFFNLVPLPPPRQ